MYLYLLCFVMCWCFGNPKHPHITKPTNTHTHTLQNKLKQPQYKIHTKWNSHSTIKHTQYKVTLT